MQIWLLVIHKCQQTKLYQCLLTAELKFMQTDKDTDGCPQTESIDVTVNMQEGMAKNST